MKYAAKSIKGVRNENQDHVFIPCDGGAAIAAVADGMGGHKAGGVASRMAIEALMEYIERNRDGGAVAIILRGIEYANTAVFNRSMDDEFSGMGTTLVLAFIEGKSYIAANVGDSRLYQYSAETRALTQVTSDHSYVAELVALGIITSEEAARHPRRNIITRALGTRENEKPDVFEREWNTGDMLLLCSDGLHGTLSAGRMADILYDNARDIDAACETLVNEALEKGSSDNISAVIVQNTEAAE